MESNQNGLHQSRLKIAFVVGIGIAVWGASTATAASLSGDHREAFPDAVNVVASCGVFESLAINDSLISETGCFFRLSNTSWGDGAASSFEREPDRHFSGDDSTLVDPARAALESNQPYGMYAVKFELAPGSGSFVSAPSGFDIEIEDEEDEVEVEFELALEPNASGFLFDDNAGSIPALFSDPQTGMWDFFISTPSPDPLGNVIDDDDDSDGISVEVDFAWMADGEIKTRFSSFEGRRLEVEKQITSVAQVPEPSTSVLLVLGIGLLGLKRRPAFR